VAGTTAGYLGPYRLLNVVNTGRTTQVWQAVHDGKKQFFGIKVLRKEFQKNREQLSLMKREYTVGSKLKHPRIIRIFDFEKERGELFLVMEWFSAPNLKRLIHTGTDNLAHLAPKIIQQACQGLSNMHQQGWVHRDVKPDNFLVTDKGNTKLIDFALSVKTKKGLGRFLAAKTKVQGTRSYMAPEQILGQPVDGRTDLYSLGCVIYEMLASRLPFTGTSTNELLNKHLKATPPSLETTNPNVTPEMSRLVQKAMAKKPSGRHDSIEDFLTAFQMTKLFHLAPTPPKRHMTLQPNDTVEYGKPPPNAE